MTEKRMTFVVLPILALVFLFLAGPEPAAAGTTHATLGVGQGRVSTYYGQLPREDLLYAQHCDDTFEQAYAWWHGGQGDPYYGAFAERYDVGPGEVSGIRLYLTQLGGMNPDLTEDLFVWGHGLDGLPGAVLGMVAGVPVDPVAVWPNVSAHDYAISASVGETFYIGCQANWPLEDHIHWYNAVDYTGPLGDPLTCVLPSLPDPDGWVDVDIIFGDDAHSMGIGVYYVPSGVSGGIALAEFRVTSWGKIKSLYDR